MIGRYLRLHPAPKSRGAKPSDSLFALVGPIAEQPYYSPADPRHAEAAGSGIALSGGGTQYHANFNHRTNLPFAQRITGPVYF